MKKYLAYYETEWPANIAELTAVENKPFVGYLKGEGVQFTVVPAKEEEPEIDLTVPYVTFTAEEDNSSIGLEKLSTNQTLEYSIDTTTWNTFDTTTNISLNNSDKVYVRGVLISDNSISDYTNFKMSGKIAASGNCNALWNYQDLSAPLKQHCGQSMFSCCASLTTAPELPATTLADYCCSSMFEGCTSLTQAPELPATELAYNCYVNMFRDCTSLTTASELPATTLAKYCYSDMFWNCTSLTTAPKILPATTLADYCYEYMFSGCTSLTQAPALPATKLKPYCYRYMFNGCSNLNYIKCLATNPSQITYNWISDVASTGTFVKSSGVNWRTGARGIPSGWTVEDAVL